MVKYKRTLGNIKLSVHHRHHQNRKATRTFISVRAEAAHCSNFYADLLHLQTYKGKILCDVKRTKGIMDVCKN